MDSHLNGVVASLKVLLALVKIPEGGVVLAPPVQLLYILLCHQLILHITSRASVTVGASMLIIILLNLSLSLSLSLSPVSDCLCLPLHPHHLSFPPPSLLFWRSVSVSPALRLTHSLSSSSGQLAREITNLYVYFHTTHCSLKGTEWILKGNIVLIYCRRQ